MATDGNGFDDAVVIERDFDAPVEIVWRMWTDPEHFRVWYGPDGATIPVADLDVRVGGARKVCMEVASPQGPVQMWFTGEHTEVVENRRLVFTESMADEHGNPLTPADMGMPAGPATTEVVVELTDAGGRTSMVLTHRGVPSDSPAAGGWTMAFDKLAAHVAAGAGR